MPINDVFKAMADPTRREILRLLKERDMTAGELSSHFDVSKPTMSGHFNVLKSAGLIVSERNRNMIVYSINTSALEDALGAVIGLFQHSSPQPTNGRSEDDQEGEGKDG